MILPMADLFDKGRAFVSPIIILTSNKAFGGPILAPGSQEKLEDPYTVWRRIHFPIRVQRSGEVHLSRMKLVPGADRRKFWEKKYYEGCRGSEKNHRGFSGVYPLEKKLKFRPPMPYGEASPFEDMIDFADLNRGFITGELKESIDHHMDYHDKWLSSTWTQRVGSIRVTTNVDLRRAPLVDLSVERVDTPYDTGSDYSLDYTFPSFPPYKAPEVAAIALKEPLKVRMITKAEADTKCLQPLQ
jgi:hypothetical protein